MICFGSGSDFEKNLIPDSRSRQYLAQFPKHKKLHKILPFECQKQLISQKVSFSLIIVFTFLLHFMMAPDPNPVSKPEHDS